MNKAVIIESPYAGDVKLNKAYLQHCIREATKRGLTPYASHQMLTEALDDTVPEERALGIALGLMMRDILLNTDVAEVWFCTDLGWSKGMRYAKASAPRKAKEMCFFEDGELELFKARRDPMTSKHQGEGGTTWKCIRSPEYGIQEEYQCVSCGRKTWASTTPSRCSCQPSAEQLEAEIVALKYEIQRLRDLLAGA